MTAAAAPRPLPPGSSADPGAVVRAYLVRMLVLLESREIDALKDSLRHRRWRQDLDLSRIPGMLLEQTDHLLMAAMGALTVDRPAEARDAIEQALEGWDAGAGPG